MGPIALTAWDSAPNWLRPTDRRRKIFFLLRRQHNHLRSFIIYLSTSCISILEFRAWCNLSYFPSLHQLENPAFTESFYRLVGFDVRFDGTFWPSYVHPLIDASMDPHRHHSHHSENSTLWNHWNLLNYIRSSSPSTSKFLTQGYKAQKWHFPKTVVDLQLDWCLFPRHLAGIRSLACPYCHTLLPSTFGLMSVVVQFFGRACDVDVRHLMSE